MTPNVLVSGGPLLCRTFWAERFLLFRHIQPASFIAFASSGHHPSEKLRMRRNKGLFTAATLTNAESKDEAYFEVRAEVVRNVHSSVA
jgi:hypothetical protein